MAEDRMPTYVMHEGKKYARGKPHPTVPGKVIDRITVNEGPAEVFTLYFKSGGKEEINFNSRTIAFY